MFQQVILRQILTRHQKWQRRQGYVQAPGEVGVLLSDHDSDIGKQENCHDLDWMGKF